MTASDSIRGASRSPLPLLSRNSVLYDDKEEYALPYSDNARFHRFPYPHFHVYYDSPKKGLFGRKKVTKVKEPKYEYEESDEHGHQHTDTADHSDTDDFNDDEEKGKDRKRRSKQSDDEIYNDDPDSGNNQWARYYNTQLVSNPNSKNKQKNVEYSYYREVNDPSPKKVHSSPKIKEIVDVQEPVPVSTYHEVADNEASPDKPVPLNDDDGYDEGGGDDGSKNDDGDGDYNNSYNDGGGSYSDYDSDRDNGGGDSGGGDDQASDGDQGDKEYEFKK